MIGVSCPRPSISPGSPCAMFPDSLLCLAASLAVPLGVASPPPRSLPTVTPVALLVHTGRGAHYPTPKPTRLCDAPCTIAGSVRVLPHSSPLCRGTGGKRCDIQLHALFMILQLSNPVRSSMDVDEPVSAGLQLSLACRSGREV